MNKESIHILAIESSCDDTSASVIKDGEVLSNYISNQEIHRIYGGVVPELASRAHQQNIIPVVQIALSEAGISKEQLSAIAFTRGPGLLGSLIVGVSFAKSLGLALGIPLIEVHHMQAHIMAHFAEKPHPEFPFLCLTVSGGHTQIVVVHSFLEMEILGQTIDDAAGEAFDKAGKMLGLEYPAGPIIDRIAKSGTPSFTFAKPKVNKLDFSFSGLKTSILYFLKAKVKEDSDFIKNNLPDLCASVQATIVDILISKLIAASEITGINQIAIAGGVSANSELRSRLQEESQNRNWEYFIPSFQLCTDNAAMIGITAYFKYLKGEFSDQEVTPMPRMAF